jgi:serine/threonine protein kinase
MSQCLNPDCLQKNPKNAELCQHCGANLQLHQQYRAMKVIGEGGFGRTFLAFDESQSEEPACVIKQFCPQTQGSENLEQASQLFAQEAQRLRELGKHPQIPELRAYFTQGNQQYVVQEYIDGRDLAQILETEGKFSEKQIQDVLEQLLPVLDDLHQRQIIHRDIKPANIIRRQDGTFILVDFGAAKHVPTTAFSVTGTTIGSAEYVSPEQAMGKAQPNSDVYSLGVTCLHLLTRITPFELFDVAEMAWAWRDYVDVPIQQELGEILDKMTVQATKKRYQSASEVLRDLQSAKAPSSSPSQPKPKFSSLSPSTATSGSQVELRSAVGYDYTRLWDLLAKQKWKAADKETANAMLKVAGRDKFLRVEDMDNFPCEDLRTIDRLWVKSSNGKFGFSVQKEIYIKLGGTQEFDTIKMKKFGNTVGWRENGKWKDYKELNWGNPLIPFWGNPMRENTPQGHLPSFVWWGFGWGVELISSLAQRLVNCHI